MQGKVRQNLRYSKREAVGVSREISRASVVGKSHVLAGIYDYTMTSRHANFTTCYAMCRVWYCHSVKLFFWTVHSS